MLEGEEIILNETETYQIIYKKTRKLIFDQSKKKPNKVNENDKLI